MRNRLLKIFILIVSGIALSACLVKPPNSLTAAPPEALTASTEFIAAVHNGDIDKITSLSIEEFSQLENLDGEITRITQYAKTSQNGLPVLIGTEKRRSGNTAEAFSIFSSTYEVPAENGAYHYFTIYTQSVDEGYRVRHFTFDEANRQLTTMHKLTFKGKTLRHYVFFALLILVALFCIITAIICFRDKTFSSKRRKVAWVAFTAIGLYGFKLNWTTGEIGYPLLEKTVTSDGVEGISLILIDLQLFGASITSSLGFAPWILEVSLPIGAILYWIKRAKRQPQNDAPTVSPTSPL